MILPRLLTMLALILGSIVPASAQPDAPPPKVESRLLSGPAPDGNGYLLGLELTPREGWHTYWRNPGDAGLGTRLRWELPDQASTGPLLWPAPKPYREGELMTYGYGQTHTLLSRLQLPAEVADDALISLKARWLVCKDICIPESAEFSLSAGDLRLSGHNDTLLMAYQALPQRWPQDARFARHQDQFTAYFELPASWLEQLEQPYWFVGEDKLLQHASPPQWQRNGNGIAVSLPLQQDAELPAQLDGVLSLVLDGQAQALELKLQAGPLPDDLQPWNLSATDEGPGLGLILLMAFVGGLILNLMPCVFPVLTLKAMNLARAESLREKRQESLAYTCGVVLSFLLIASVLLALRAGGAALGWGFQLQNPLVVGLLACLMALLGLALLGWTQLGMSLMGMGQGLTQQSGLRGAFFTGVLAVIVASPCSAPFMGSALGYAVLQPAPVALGIFAALGAGLAAPFAMLPWTPGLARRLPKPGPWMETLKHWLALPMLLTAAWLFWVLWRQAGDLTLGLSLAAAIALALALRQKPGEIAWKGWQKAAAVIGLALLSSPVWVPQTPPQRQQDIAWQTWSKSAIEEARTHGQMVFVDFTADWCLSCIANERAVLASERVQSLFDEHQVLMLKADWTRYDPLITAELAAHGRNGVPLYLLYPPGASQPAVLPEILTPAIIERAVLDAAGG